MFFLWQKFEKKSFLEKVTEIVVKKYVVTVYACKAHPAKKISGGHIWCKNVGWYHVWKWDFVVQSAHFKENLCRGRKIFVKNKGTNEI